MMIKSFALTVLMPGLTGALAYVVLDAMLRNAEWATVISFVLATVLALGALVHLRLPIRWSHGRARAWSVSGIVASIAVGWYSRYGVFDPQPVLLMSVSYPILLLGVWRAATVEAAARVRQ
jgi:hypothetical protein